jgi:hypothetical protein
MARVTGPLMSFDASGTIAGSVVFSKWRGRNYVRRHAIPSNPRTTGQLAARAIIAFLGSEWASLSAPQQATWLAGGDALKISAFNNFVKINARDWRDQIMPAKDFPATRILTPAIPTSITPTVSGRQVLLSIAYTGTMNEWGLVLCRSATSIFTATASNAVQVIPSAVSPILIVDGPLSVGTYYYNAFFFGTDGKRAGQDTEATAVIV